MREREGKRGEGEGERGKGRGGREEGERMIKTLEIALSIMWK